VNVAFQDRSLTPSLQFSERSYMSTPLTLPYPPLVVVETEKPLSWAELEEVYGDRLDTGLSLCVCPYRGPKYRGGYFFHIVRKGSSFSFSTFDRAAVLEVDSGKKAVEIINHASGLEYSEAAWKTLRSVDLKTD